MSAAKHKRHADGGTDANKYDQETYDETSEQGSEPSNNHKRPKDKKGVGNANEMTKTYRENAEFKLSDELGKLLEGEEFGDEFKDQAVTIFEAAVNDAIKQHIQTLDEQYEQDIEAERGTIREELENEVDKYLTYAVNEWKDENKIALERGIRNEINESLMEQVLDVFKEHYHEVPEGKVDAYEEAVEKAGDLEEQLNEKVERVVSLEEQVNEMQKRLVLEGYTRNLTDVEAEKLKSLAEDIQFESEEQFTKKLDTLRENFAGGTAGKKDTDSLTEDVDPVPSNNPESDDNDPMNVYLRALKKG